MDRSDPHCLVHPVGDGVAGVELDGLEDGVAGGGGREGLGAVGQGGDAVAVGGGGGDGVKGGGGEA